MKIKIIFFGLAVLLFASCKKILNPEPEDLKSLEQMYTDVNYAQGILITAYRNIPGYYDNSEFATDDAVTNQLNNPAYLQLATGSWSSINNPTSVWDRSYEAIQYLNLFLENSDKVKWAIDPEAAKLFNVRMRGEAYGLRALFMYYLLRNHGGVAGGQLLGVPIVTQYQKIDAQFNVPRASFDACVKQIYSDLDNAELNLPVEYNDISTNAQIPDRFKQYTGSFDTYNRVMGQYGRQLFNGLIAKVIRSRTALLAASPAFQNSANPATWADAAKYSAEIINYKGGVGALPATGVTYYANNTEIDNLASGINPPEMIWRENIATNDATQEALHFPPSINGNTINNTGVMNPSQNLVDAFPMANGYPINHPNANYSAAAPYNSRDPRFAKYIIYNGAPEGVSNTIIKTGSASGTTDGINARPGFSTRTGYYMKKRLRMDVNRVTGLANGKTHYTPRMRYTEMYLAYAEAANEAFGPTGTGTQSYSAYDVIKAIRKRALGINTDPYLEEIKGDQGKMRDLIRNERRLELSFESFRFWDLRRWKVDITKLNEPVRGMDVNGTVYTPLNSVETRSYQNYMFYGPIPNSELLKYNSLVQNTGW